MDGEVPRIQSQLRRIERERVRLDQERRRLLEEQSERRADQTPALVPRLIRRQLRDLDRKRDRLDHDEEDLRKRERSLRVRLGSTPSSSSPSRSTGSAPRVRQSALYSARRGPRGRVGEHTAEVSSSEPGNTNTDLSQFEALTLNTTPPTLESDDRVVEHPPEVTSSEREGTSVNLSKVEGLSLSVTSPASETTDGAVMHAGDMDSRAPDSTNAKQPAVREGLSPRCEESTEQIIENGRKWMKEEVMEAYKKYIKETNRFRGVEFELDKLLHQCLSVETYEKIFHHYNFTVKTKQAGSDKWSSTLYFAQVKEMYGRKFYFCYPLDPLEAGLCHACKNQGMDALQHPAVPIGYETGQADTGCPFFDDSSDDGDRVPDDDGMAWAFSQAFLGGVPY